MQWFQLCTGRDLEMCDTCKRNIENNTNTNQATFIKPTLSEDKSECADYIADEVTRKFQ